MRIIRTAVLAAAACAALVGFEAVAQTGPAFPARPVRLVVPFAPGGPVDVVARLISPKLSERLGQPMLVDNRVGAGGNIGSDSVIKAAPDGHTLLYAVPFLVTNPFFIKGSPDPTELAPVIQMASNTMLLLASSSFAPKTVAEVISHIRANPNKVICGSSGALPTVGCELLRSHAKADMVMVPYKGNAPALNALMSGEINLLFDSANTAAPQVKSGRIRAVASLNFKRGGAQFPDLPTVSETIPGFEFLAWHGVLAPKATPRDIVQRLNREFAAVLALPEVRTRLTDTGFEIVASSPESFEGRIGRDLELYGKVAKDAGIKPQ
jgi:tripartite-type tricarboxylate transporter receptor subunit TctC